MRFTVRRTGHILVAGVIGFCSTLVAAAVEEPFEPRVVIKKEFPAITNAPIMSAREASSRIQSNEIILGVVVNGKARAYPINMLTGPSREIVNDTLGGRAIAATW